MSVREIQERVNNLTLREREILAEVGAEMTAEQRTNLDKIDKDLTQAIADRDLALKAEGRQSLATYAPPKNDPAEQRASDPSEHAKKVNREFRDFVLSDKQGTFSFRGREYRDLQANDDVKGGYTVAKEQFNAELIKAVDDQVFMRAQSRAFTLVNAESLGTPSRDANATNATWGAELTVGASDTGLKYGKRDLTPHPLSAYIKVSKKFLRASGIDAEAEVRDRLAYALSIPQEIAFLNGSGANQPLGLFTVSANGVSTDRDITTASSSGTIASYEELIDVQYTLKGAYWRNSSWVFNRFHHKDIRKIKDGNGNPVWMPAGLGTVLNAVTYDTLLTRPVFMSEFAPVSTAYGSTSLTASIVGSSAASGPTGRVAIFGDLSQYWTATALDLQIDHLVELGALTNQDIFIARVETDGAPVLSEAFAVLRLKGY